MLSLNFITYNAILVTVSEQGAEGRGERGLRKSPGLKAGDGEFYTTLTVKIEKINVIKDRTCFQRQVAVDRKKAVIKISVQSSRLIEKRKRS